MSARSLSVSAPADKPPPCLLMPLLSDKLAADHDARVDARPVHGRDVQHELAVVEQQRVAGAHVLRQTLVGDADGRLRARVRVERNVEREGSRLRSARPCRRRSARCGSSVPADRRARRPTCRPARATERTISTRLACACGSPCEKLTRTTSAPARSMSASTLGLSVAGPSVVRILVRRSIRSIGQRSVRRRALRALPPPAASCLRGTPRKAPPPVEM